MMKLSCTKAREWITQLADGELAEAEQTSLAEHLRVCTDCRRERDAVEAMRELWSDPPSLVSDPADREAILEAARPLLERGPMGWLTRLRLWWTPVDLVTAGAVAVSVVLAVVLLQGRQVSDLPPGWSRSYPAFSIAELRARQEDRPIEIEKSPETIQWS